MPDRAERASGLDGAGPGGGRRRARPEPTAAQRALGLLVRREHSQRELARKLEARGVPEPEAADAIERMARDGWQDDGRFAEWLVRSRAASGYGPVRIRAELVVHGIADTVAAAAFKALAEMGGDDWQANAEAVLRRRFGGALPGLEARRKAADLLARRGFEAHVIRAACRWNGGVG